MANKPSVLPTVAILTVAVFLLITFWRTNMAIPDYVYNPGADSTPHSKGDAHVAEPTTVTGAEPTTVTVTVTATVSALQTPATVTPSKDKPRYIFVDLGANRVDSLEAFLQHPDAKFKYDFPSPGWATHDDAEIFLFEANPVFNDALVHAKQHYAGLGKDITIYPSTVVDTKDGIRTFYLDDVNTDHDFWGSSTYKNHQDAVASGAKGTELSGINISRWLLMNTLPHDFVVVKMDIEGAEYDILPHMAEMRVWTVVDYLLVEWHDSLPTNEARQTAVKAMEKLKEEGVSCPKYDSPA